MVYMGLIKSQSYLNWMLLSETEFMIPAGIFGVSQSYLNWMLLSEIFIITLRNKIA